MLYQGHNIFVLYCGVEKIALEQAETCMSTYKISKGFDSEHARHIGQGGATNCAGERSVASIVTMYASVSEHECRVR